MIKAECTWGDGPDVLVSWDDFIMMHYNKNSGSFDLTAKQAKQFAYELLCAVNSVEEIENIANAHDSS